MELIKSNALVRGHVRETCSIRMEPDDVAQYYDTLNLILKLQFML